MDGPSKVYALRGSRNKVGKIIASIHRAILADGLDPSCGDWDWSEHVPSGKIIATVTIYAPQKQYQPLPVPKDQIPCEGLFPSDVTVWHVEAIASPHRMGDVRPVAPNGQRYATVSSGGVKYEAHEYPATYRTEKEAIDALRRAIKLFMGQHTAAFLRSFPRMSRVNDRYVASVRMAVA